LAARRERPRRIVSGGAQLVAGDLDERVLELVRVRQLAVGPLQLLVLRLHLLEQPLAVDDQVVALAALANDRLQLLGVPGLGEVAEDVAPG
jgi:hypothetical protein